MIITIISPELYQRHKFAKHFAHYLFFFYLKEVL